MIVFFEGPVAINSLACNSETVSGADREKLGHNHAAERMDHAVSGH